MEAKDKTLKYISILIVCILFGFCFVFFAFFYRYHLHFIEQMQLFQLTSEYFKGYFSKPAALASYLGDFFTQFYYLKTGGAIVITCSLILLWWFLNKLIYTFSRAKWIWILPLLITLFVALLHCDIHYYLASTIALIIVIASVLVYTSFNNQRIRFLLGSLFIPLLYILAGGFFFIFIPCIVMYEWKLKQSKIVTISYSVLIVGLSIFLPSALRSYYNLTINQAYTYPVTGKIISLPDFQFEKLLSLDCEWYFNHPEKTLKFARKYELKNKYASYYYNLSLSHTKQLPEELMNYYQPGISGLFIPLNKQQSYISVTFSNEIYFTLGDVNASHHCVLLGMTFSPKGQSSRLMRRLVEVNIINGAYAIAEKYIKILEKTWFHRKWAKEKQKYLYNEMECSNNPWIAYKRSQIPITDNIKDNPNDFERSLVQLLKDHPENSLIMDYLLCYYLLNKDLTPFTNTILEEIRNKRIGELPKLYQEALLIYFAQNINCKAKDYVQFSPEIFNRFIDYTDKYAENMGNGDLLQSKYGKTYWFYYHYATFKTENTE